jgi:enamine deaminase RidA (YjgF/YER057c/UK114 family)
MRIKESLADLGYEYSPSNLDFPGESPFQHAAKVNDLVFTAGQISSFGNIEIRGKVGRDLSIEEGAKAAEFAAFNCLRAVGAVADVESIVRVVKVLGMVNVAEGFDKTPAVIDGASRFLLATLGEKGKHARTAVGMVLPLNWAVEIEIVFQVSS